MCIGNKIKDIRTQCLLSQEDFAKEIGVSFTTVNRRETGKCTPTYKTLRLIDNYCKQKGVNIDLQSIIMDLSK